MNDILIIEDEQLVAELLEKKLTNEGYAVRIAADGETGISEVRARTPDLILLDIVLPTYTGVEVMETMRDDGTLSEVPVIVISNSGREEEAARARELGACDWLTKTEFDPNEVLEKVKEHLPK